MNFAVLCRFKHSSRQPPDQIKELTTISRPNRFAELNETNYYRSVANLEKLYILQLIYNLDALPTIKNGLEELVNNNLNLIERLLVFKLQWDYWRLDLPVTFSTLSLVSLPADYSQEQLKEDLEVLRYQRRELPGLIGIWVGYNFKATSDREKLLRLVRMDWRSQEAYLEFIRSTTVQGIFKRYNTYSLEYCYGFGEKFDISRSNAFPDTRKDDQGKPGSGQNEAFTIAKARALSLLR